MSVLYEEQKVIRCPVAKKTHRIRMKQTAQGTGGHPYGLARAQQTLINYSKENMTSLKFYACYFTLCDAVCEYSTRRFARH